MKARVVAIFFCCAWCALAGPREYSELRRDEEIVFYPSVAAWLPGGACAFEVHGRVFEREPRRLAVAALKKALGLLDIEMTPAEQRVFDDRASLFLVDAERGKRVVVRVDATNTCTGLTDKDGWFSAKMSVRGYADDISARDGLQMRVEAVLPPGDSRKFIGTCVALKPEGISVVSDIDDTIKVTHMHDRRAMLRNTFMRQFEPVPGMAALYQELAQSNRAVFHYVSATPWQLYEPLAEFIHTNGFPAGTFHLKKFSWRTQSLLEFLAGPETHKLRVIGQLLEQFPHRQFILIGDSSERDPEIYGALARKYSSQIIGIWIRDVTGEPPEAERYQRAFEGLPTSMWEVFREAGQLQRRMLQSRRTDFAPN